MLTDPCAFQYYSSAAGHQASECVSRETMFMYDKTMCEKKKKRRKRRRNGINNKMKRLSRDIFINKKKHSHTHRQTECTTICIEFIDSTNNNAYLLVLLFANLMTHVCTVEWMNYFKVGRFVILSTTVACNIFFFTYAPNLRSSANTHTETHTSCVYLSPSVAAVCLCRFSALLPPEFYGSGSQKSGSWCVVRTFLLALHQLSSNKIIQICSMDFLLLLLFSNDTAINWRLFHSLSAKRKHTRTHTTTQQNSKN